MPFAVLQCVNKDIIIIMDEYQKQYYKTFNKVECWLICIVNILLFPRSLTI